MHPVTLTLTPPTAGLRDRTVGLVTYSGVVLAFVHHVPFIGLQQCQDLHVIILLGYGVRGLSGLQTHQYQKQSKIYHQKYGNYQRNVSLPNVCH